MNATAHPLDRTDDGLTRVERKRRDARRRIVRAAERLMSERPIDDVTIADITRAADVGHGSFYLHFQSKYEVLAPVVHERAAAWDAHVRDHLGDRTDPAEIFAFTARHMAHAALRDPLWRWYLVHSGVPIDDMRAAIGRFGARDVGVGLESGRFRIPDLATTTRFVLGAYVSTLLGCFDLDPDDASASIDDMVELVLRVLGVPTDEAADLAHRPLPDLDPPTT